MKYGEYTYLQIFELKKLNELINYNIANYKECFFLDNVKNYDKDFFFYKPITINYQLQNANPDEKLIDNIYSTVQIENYNQMLFNLTKYNVHNN